MKTRVDRSYHRDIENLNSRYITLLKNSIDTQNIADNHVLHCCPSAIHSIRNIDKTEPLVACNVLQFIVIVVPEPIQTPPNKLLQQIIRETLLFYREYTKTNPDFTQSTTGLKKDTALSFAEYTYTEIDEIVLSKRCVIRMRFFDGYWRNIQDVADDSPANLLLITATQAANETYRNR